MRRPGYWVHGAVSLQNAQAYDAIRQLLKYKYTALENELLKQPAWQVYMFLLAPFSSVAGDVCYLDTGKTHVRAVSVLYCRKDRAALWETVDGFQDEWARALRRFYKEKITMPSPEKIAFDWSPYKRPAQLCYSLAMELLIAISCGVHPEGSRLPTIEPLSRQKDVSVSAVRRALTLRWALGRSNPFRVRGSTSCPSAKALKTVILRSPPSGGFRIWPRACRFSPCPAGRCPKPFCPPSTSTPAPFGSGRRISVWQGSCGIMRGSATPYWI